MVSQIKRKFCHLVRKEQLAKGIMRLLLKQENDQPLRFRAGQHIDVLTNHNQRRSFSLANALMITDFLNCMSVTIKGALFLSMHSKTLKEVSEFR